MRIEPLAPTNIVPDPRATQAPFAPAIGDSHARSAFDSRAAPQALSIPSRWFALRVRSRHEFAVRDALDAGAFKSFLPTYSETVRWTDRTKITIRPLFCGYVFARFMRIAEQARVLSITGVIQILGRDELSCIPDAEIDNIRLVASLPAVPCPYVAVGKAVVITSGPLTGVSGVVVKTKGSLRLVVSVEMLGQSCAITIDAADVTEAKP